MNNLLDGELNTYDKTQETKESYLKQIHWNMAIGLQQVDGLTPSKYLITLADDNINGNLSSFEIQSMLNEYYSTQNMNDKKVSDEHECDLVAARIVELLNDKNFTFRPITLKIIHEYLFKDIYDFAGVYRTYNITKKEPILDGDTVIYSSYNEIEMTLDYDFEKEMKHDYSKLTLQEQINQIADFTSGVWQIHPFGEGNTRTVAVMIEKYLRSLGYNVNNDLFKEHSVYFRNALIRSNYENRNENVYPTNKYLIKFFENLLAGKNHDLNSEELVIHDIKPFTLTL